MIPEKVRFMCVGFRSTAVTRHWWMGLGVARVCGNWMWSWTPAGHAGAAGGLASELEVGPAGGRPWGATPPGSERCSSLASSLPPRACPRPRWSACHPPGPPGCGSALWWLTRSVLAHAWPWAPCTETDCPGETVKVHQLGKSIVTHTKTIWAKIIWY